MLQYTLFGAELLKKEVKKKLTLFINNHGFLINKSY
jgi:hypothetical protein